MKLVDVKARNEKDFEAIQRKVTAYVKSMKGKCNLGDLRFSSNGGVYYIELDNDGELADDLADFVKKSPNGIVMNATDYKGTYDWTSDTYARPSSIVTFKF
jgi:hypothetical protein